MKAIFRELKTNKFAMISLLILALLFTLALFAPFIAPYGYDNQARDYGFQKPELFDIHIFTDDGNLSRPFIYGMKDIRSRYPIYFFERGDPYNLFGLIPTSVHLFLVENPERIYLFGSDQFGRDIFSRILYGAQVSMTIGLFGVIISLAIAMLIGGIAGFFGGALDFFLMRVIEVIIAVPGLYLLIALRGLFPLRTSSITVYFLLVIVLACIGWAANARVIRGLVLSIRERDYVIAARVLGVSNCGIIIKHIIPNTYSYIIIAATLSVPYYILGEISLSFLGLGISEPYASWGNMLTSAQNIQYLSLYPWILTPGIFIFITILAFNFLGDGLRDALDPKE